MIFFYRCPVDDKLISRFRGSWSESGVFETQVFAYMKTFRFTGSPALYIECDVRMCHGRCPVSYFIMNFNNEISEKLNIIVSQTQPCHWRNVKTHRKREVEAETTSVGPSTLSENINLFQSLRVLQEDEEDDDYTRNYTKSELLFHTSV